MERPHLRIRRGPRVFNRRTRLTQRFGVCLELGPAFEAQFTRNCVLGVSELELAARRLPQRIRQVGPNASECRGICSLRGLQEVLGFLLLLLEIETKRGS